MAFSDRLTGGSLYVAFIHSGGTADLSGDFRSFDPKLGIDTVDGSAGNDTARAMKGTLKTYSASLSTVYSGTAGTANAYAVREGVEGTLLWGPLGTASGKPKGGFPAVVKKADVSHPYNEYITVAWEFEGQGALTYDPRSATF